MLKRIVFFLTLSLSLYGIAYAQTFNVATTAQLRTALENASVNGSDDTIILEAGTYKTTDDGQGTFIFVDTEAHNLTIKAKDGLTANDVILDGANTHQVLNLKSTKTATFTLERVTVRNGKSSGNGGGIYTNNGLIVTNATISGNITASSGFFAGSSGGGISGSIVTVINSTISGNTVPYGDGGGIYGSIVTVINSTISGNTVPYGDGGGIYGSIVTVINSTISDNTASSSTLLSSTPSGGIYGHGTFINNIFDNNNADIYFTGDSNVYNNYIDYAKLQNESSYTIIKKNNIQPSSGSLNFADSSFRLGAGSVAIDKGLDPNSTTFTNLFTGSTTLRTVQNALQTDKDGNSRIAGAAIDLGAYEYGAIHCTLTISPSSQTFTSTGGTGTVTVTASAGSCTWTSSSSLSWVTITSGASGTGSGTVTFSVSANTTGAARTGNITIAGQTFTITQAGTSTTCTYSISPASQTFTSKVGTGSVTVTASSSSCSWTASEALSWVSITSGSSGKGSGTVAYSVSANTSKAARTGNMTIAGKTFTITQKGKK